MRRRLEAGAVVVPALPVAVAVQRAEEAVEGVRAAAQQHLVDTALEALAGRHHEAEPAPVRIQRDRARHRPPVGAVHHDVRRPRAAAARVVQRHLQPLARQRLVEAHREAVEQRHEALHPQQRARRRRPSRRLRLSGRRTHRTRFATHRVDQHRLRQTAQRLQRHEAARDRDAAPRQRRIAHVEGVAVGLCRHRHHHDRVLDHRAAHPYREALRGLPAGAVTHRHRELRRRTRRRRPPRQHPAHRIEQRPGRSTQQVVAERVTVDVAALQLHAEQLARPDPCIRHRRQHGQVVDRLHRHRHHRLGARARGIRDAVREAVRAVVVRRRRVADPSALEHRRAVRGCRGQRQRQRIAVDIMVVGEHVDQHRAVLGHACAVIHRHRCVVDRRHRDHHPRRRLAAPAVSDPVDEFLAAVEVRRRRVADPPVLEHRRAVLRRRDLEDRQRILIGIAVVGQHSDPQRAVLGHRDRVVHGHRRRVRRHPHLDRHAGARARAQRVHDRVAEAVAAREAFRRRVADPPVLERHRAVGRLRQRIDRECLALGVDVVRQHVDQHRATGLDLGRIGVGHRRLVLDLARQHRHLEAARGLAHPVAHRHREAVARVRAGRGPADQPARGVDRRAVRRRIEPVGQRIAVRVARLHRQRQRHALEQFEVRDRRHHRCAVRRQHRHRDRRRRARAVGIDHRVAEAVAAREALRRRVADRTVLDRRRAVGRLREGIDRERLALRVEVVAEHVDPHRGALLHRRCVGRRQRRAVLAARGQHRHREAAARLRAAVADRDREHHRGARTARGPRDRTRRRIDRGTGRRLVEPERERIAVDVAGAHRQLQRHALDDLVIVDRRQLRCVVDRLHRHRHRRARHVAGRIDDAVGERVAAVEVRPRRVADPSVLDRQRAVRGLAHVEQRDEVPVGVAVVGQHVDEHRGVLGHGGGIGLRHRRHIHAIRPQEAHVVDAHRGVQRPEAEQVEIQRRLAAGHALGQLHRHQHRLRQVDRRQRLALQIGHPHAARAVHRAARLQVEERIRIAQPDRAHQRLQRVRIQQRHLEGVRRDPARPRQRAAGEGELQAGGVHRHLEGLRQARVALAVLAEHRLATAHRRRAAGAPAVLVQRRVVDAEAAVDQQTAERTAQVQRDRDAPHPQLQRIDHHAVRRHVGIDVRQPQHVPELVRQHRQQVHPPEGIAPGRAPRLGREREPELLAVDRCRIDEPAVARRIAVQRQPRPVGLQRHQRQQRARQVLDRVADAFERRDVRPRLQPQRLHLRDQRRHIVQRDRLGAGAFARCRQRHRHEHRVLADAAVVVGHTQRHRGRRREHVVDQQRAGDQLAADVPCNRVRITAAGVRERALQPVRAPRGSRRRHRDRDHRVGVGDRHRLAGLVEARADGVDAEVDLHSDLVLVVVTGRAIVGVAVRERERCLATEVRRTHLHLGQRLPVTEVDVEVVLAIDGHPENFDRHGDDTALVAGFGCDFDVPQELEVRILFLDHDDLLRHRIGGTAVVVGDDQRRGVGPCDKEGERRILQCRGAEDGAGVVRHHRPLIGERVELAYIGLVREQRHRAAGKGRDVTAADRHRGDVLDHQCGVRRRLAAVVVDHAHRHVARILRRATGIVVEVLVAEGLAAEHTDVLLFAEPVVPIDEHREGVLIGRVVDIDL
ncbi:MAG: hypothetical protein CALGDGBN_01922 [Pseudomonadales bacterium]|nr:hypothetical protein [Pseudomonadales bacterium]